MCVYVCIYTHIHDCVRIVYELPLLPHNNTNATFLYKAGNLRSVYWIFIIGVAGLAVADRICDIERKVVQSYFQTGSSSSPNYCHIFFRVAFLAEDCIKNIIVILCFHFIIIIYNKCNAVKILRLHVFLQNSRGHAKEFLRNVETDWARGLKNVYQPWFGVFNAAVS